jgi:NEDD8-activating enzyme E1 regulatory subunit
MKAQSADYVELQNIYKAKARSDLAKVVDRVRRIEGELQRKSPVAEKEIEAFCKGAAFIKLIRGQRLRPSPPISLEEREKNVKSICTKLQNADSLLRVHLSFLFYDLVMADLTSGNAEVPVDPDKLHARMREHIGSESERLQHLNHLWGSIDGLDIALCSKSMQNPLAELLRAKGGELHNISALTGGMVAQEIIKVITKQYVPIDNTCVLDGIRSKTEIFHRHGELFP